MPEQLPFTALLNRIFAGPVDALLRAVHLPPEYPQAPISNAVAMEILVVGFLILVFLLVRASLSVERPGGIQHIFEGLHGFITQQSREIIGHHSEGYTPFLLALGLFILCCNLIGLIPAFEAPTGASPTVPLGCAIVAFVYYHIQGVKRQGALHYAKHFAGPMPALAPLMIPIEIISHLARMLSLTIRLYANMFAGDMVTLVFFSLVPIGIPVLFMGLHIGVSFLQSYIFVLLVTVYLSGAVATEH
ncbi:MAG TPA: F0F1 ATP synthase subunit A [Terriglobales bacterium]|jgi:F-type H+-transporting ATPase subunit a|nr:F0F1 ATP synthase subunit A [Terriglobales bacterium]